MRETFATLSLAVGTPRALSRISVAGLLLLGSACAVDGPVSPTPARVPLPPPAASAALAERDHGPDACVSDSKLIGRIALSTADAPGTWWRLTREGLDAAGITDYVAAIEGFFGRDFSSLAEAVAFLVEQVGPADENGNGYVCAYSLRGTRTSIGDPDFPYYLFRVRDDKHAVN